MPFSFRLPQFGRSRSQKMVAPQSRLVACAECDYKVSPSATVCPNCKRIPWKKRCCICCKDEKQSELVTYTYSALIQKTPETLPTGEGSYARMRRMRGTVPTADEAAGAKPTRGAVSAYAHQRCLDAIRNTPQQYLCPDCGNLNRFIPTDAPFPNCATCGRAIPRTVCRSCGKPLVKGNAFRFAFWTTVGRGESVQGYYHPQCRSGIEKRGDALIAHRKTRKVCLLCGLPLGFVERLYRDTHKSCHHLRYETQTPHKLDKP